MSEPAHRLGARAKQIVKRGKTPVLRTVSAALVIYLYRSPLTWICEGPENLILIRAAYQIAYASMTQLAADSACFVQL